MQQLWSLARWDIGRCVPSPKTYWATRSRPTPSLPPVATNPSIPSESKSGRFAWDGRSMVGSAWSPKATMFLGTVGGQKRSLGVWLAWRCFLKTKNGQKVSKGRGLKVER